MARPRAEHRLEEEGKRVNVLLTPALVIVVQTFIANWPDKTQMPSDSGAVRRLIEIGGARWDQLRKRRARAKRAAG